MIRHICLLSVAGLLFIVASWNFYTQAVRHNPFSEVTARKTDQKEPVTVVPAKYGPGWSDVIYEKNLFNPLRTYQEPKPVVAPVAPPPVVEPPKRPDITLKGIILDSFGDYVAYIEIDRAKAAPMRKGDKKENIELIELSGREAVLQWNSEMITLNLDKIKTIDKPKAPRK
ncbi:MAG: hypothetical protein HZB33_00415 [Nitrospirae bacterium]|nr:hypothetical protein [Nitrospirota bacterium]